MAPFSPPLSAPFSPRLRPDLLVERTADGVIVSDPVLRRRLNLGAIEPVLARLDGRPVADLLAEGAQTEAILRTLLLLHLLDGPGADALDRMRRVQDGRETPPLRTLAGSRFACQGSGGCCQSYVFGPLTDTEVARVESNDLSPFLPSDPPGGAFYERRVRPDGRVERFLRTTADGRCVFLDRANRCGLHARYGAASKPGFCQLFPLVAWPTVDGLRVYDGGECASAPASAADGPPVDLLYAEVAHLLPGNVLPGNPPGGAGLQHPLVHLDPGAPCDLTVFTPVQDALVAVITDGAPLATLHTLEATLSAAIQALRTCPIALEEPRRSLLVSLEHPAITPPSLAQGSLAGREAIALVARELAEVFAAPLSQPGRAPPFTREVLAGLARLAATAEGTAPPLPPEDPSTFARNALSFRQHLFGSRALVDGRPRAALLRLTLGWMLSRAADAEGVGTPGHMLVNRRLDMPWAPLHRVWIRREGLLRPILSAAGAL